MIRKIDHYYITNVNCQAARTGEVIHFKFAYDSILNNTTFYLVESNHTKTNWIVKSTDRIFFITHKRIGRLKARLLW